MSKILLSSILLICSLVGCSKQEITTQDSVKNSETTTSINTNQSSNSKEVESLQKNTQDASFKPITENVKTETKVKPLNTPSDNKIANLNKNSEQIVSKKRSDDVVKTEEKENLTTVKNVESLIANPISNPYTPDRSSLSSSQIKSTENINNVEDAATRLRAITNELRTIASNQNLSPEERTKRMNELSLEMKAVGSKAKEIKQSN